MQILIEVDTNTNIPFTLDIVGLEDWFEDQINSEIGSMSDENIEYAYPKVKVIKSGANRIIYGENKKNK